MGNRAIIQTKESFENGGIGVYLHWNGGYDSVSAFLKYCELKGYRAPDQDCYGWARLCQVIGNFFGGGLSIGIDNFSQESGKWADNGTYIIKGWKIVDREYYNYPEQDNYDFLGTLIDIDRAQPEKEQLGEEFLTAPEIPVDKLKIGDVVWVQSGYDGTYEKYAIEGFGDELVNGSNMSNVPYVAMYGDKERGYAWNCNNYIRTKTVRVAQHRKEKEND